MEEHNKPEFLKDFPPVPTEAWEEKILEDLKGADYDKRLVWKTTDGITARPYYRAADLASLPFMGSLPGEAPYVRGKKIKSNDWDIRQDFDEEDISVANELARDALRRGAIAVGLNARAVESLDDMHALLQGIDLSEHAVHLMHGKSYLPLLRYLVICADDATLRGSLNFDPLGYYVLYGKPYDSLDANMDEALALCREIGDRHPQFRLVTINGQHYHNAGAGIVQELAYALSQANEYLVQMTHRGISAEEIVSRILFRIAVGSDYFLEIAKLRAIRMLWARVVAHYHPKSTESMHIAVHAESSAWNKSMYDAHTNLLRTTTEAMAAAIGGVDSITLAPFDSTYKKPGDFSRRLARNQQIILKHESYFDKVVDPSAGSYYIEKLTDSYARAAWDQFLAIEKMGGFVQAVEQGFIATSIAETCRKRDMDIAMRKKVFVGTNQYPNPAERILDKIEPTARFSDLGGLKPYRGTQAFEALRLDLENYEQQGNATPAVFLLTYGNLAMRKARATFSTNFFGIAGYKILEGSGYQHAAAGIDDAIASRARVIVFCSSDEEYAEIPGLIAAIRRKAPDTLLVVAGYPAELLDQLNEAGVDDYIHLRTHALDALTRFHEKLLTNQGMTSGDQALGIG